jgi:2-polyprenyl-6-methoxyphenol hydroxylase-like FAD-dependent oxidoreductase
VNTPTPLHDVIVVGARPAGAATAMLLARAGLRVAVLERSARATDTTSTHALMRGGVLQLARWGVLDRIVDAGTPPVRSTVYNYGGARRRIAIRPAYGVDALYAPRRTLLDPVLADAAREAGADVRYGTPVTGLIWDRGRVVGVRTGRAGASSLGELRARLIVGADGIRSIVARKTEARTTAVGRWRSAVTYGYWANVAADGYEWTFHRDACTGAIPTGDGLVCVFASGTPRRIGRGGVEVIRSVAATADPTLAERLADGDAPNATRTWPGTTGFLRRAHGPGWALVGDAGYFKDPIVAHGITDALRDAELLARAVTSGIDDERGLAAALAEYQSTRDDLSRPLLETADRIASQRWDDAELDDLVRRISSATAAEVELLAGLDQPVCGGAR